MEQALFPQTNPEAIPAVQWHGDGETHAMDCETATLLRLSLKPLFDGAQSWRDLVAALSSRDYGLHLKYGRLLVVNQQTRNAICTGSFLGAPLRDLVERLGSPSIIQEDGTDHVARVVAA
ncbi:hypothetical protein [Mesobacterium pallidum]|uniref:hypothetical protein n=1 Tax=Mesobacterium pallidum TaxID=2872037 RepID=UPI001EE1DE6E|nr:hypothetical protein [Mesobacterium pallidum]